MGSVCSSEKFGVHLFLMQIGCQIMGGNLPGPQTDQTNGRLWQISVETIHFVAI